MKRLPPVHPGEILLEEFLIPLGMSQSALARYLDLPSRRIHEICQGKRGISVDTAIRLGYFFENSAEFWLNLQALYDLECSQDAMEGYLKSHVRPYSQISHRDGPRLM